MHRLPNSFPTGHSSRRTELFVTITFLSNNPLLQSNSIVVYVVQSNSSYSTEEGDCCLKTLSLRTASGACLSDLLEKREGACASFVLKKKKLLDQYEK